jgi:hypothetical protein
MFFLGLFNSALKKRSTQGKCGLECVFLPHSGFVQQAAQTDKICCHRFCKKTQKSCQQILPLSWALYFNYT